MQTVTYKTKGTCSKSITFERDEQNRIHNIKFEGGCDGNLKAIPRLVEGMTVEEVEKEFDKFAFPKRSLAIDSFFIIELLKTF